MTRHGGSGDPTRSLHLLWQDTPTAQRRARGRPPALRLPEIVAAAIDTADGAGIEAVSMRHLAKELGVGTMSLYTYIPGKAELVDLMVDTVHGELYPDTVPRDLPAWRTRLEFVAWENWRAYRRHPWLMEVDLWGRPALGPGTITKYDSELASVEGVGLDDVQMDSVVALVVGHAQTSARAAVNAQRIRRDTAVSDEEWWRLWGPQLRQVLDPQRFPLATRVGSRVGAVSGSAHDPEHAFAFGLQRIVDGVAGLIAAAGGH